MIEAAIKKNNLQDVQLHTDKTVVCMEGASQAHLYGAAYGAAELITTPPLNSGPSFSTRAESKMYRQLGGDIIKYVWTSSLAFHVRSG